MIKMMLIAGAGGFAGTCVRYLAGQCVSHLWGGSYPLATLLVNAVGCFLIGLLAGGIERANLLSPAQGVLLITGFCGGLTTFSAFANEIWSIGTRGEWIAGVVYGCLSVVTGVALVAVGRILMR